MDSTDISTASDAVETDQIWRSIRRLASKGDKMPTIKELDQLASHGLNERCFTGVLDEILNVNSTCNVREKRALIKLLIPQFEPDTVVVYKVLSAVGYPRVYYKEGHKITQARLPLAIQTELLDWMVSNIYIFGPWVFKELHKLGVILFNLLSFEFCRLQICHLIFLMLTNTDKTRKFNNVKVAIVKQWQIKMVVDLSVKFPTDNFLKVLLILFKQLVPGLDYKQYNSRVGSVSADSGLKIPFSKVILVSEVGPVESQVQSRKRRMIETCIGHYKIFNSKISKRRKTNDQFLTWYNANMTINDMANLTDLVSNIQELNVSYRELFRQSNKLKYDYIILYLLINGSDKNFKYYVENGENNQDWTDLFKYYPRISQFLDPNKLSSNVMEFMDEIPMSLIEDTIRNNRYSLLFRQLYRYMLRACKREDWMKINHIEEIFKLVDIRKLDLELTISLVKFLKIYSKIPLAELSDTISPESVLIPSPVIYHLMFTINPLVFSETCGYINSIKKYSFDDEYKRILNTIIMDLLNFIWRDKAFHKQPNTFHQAMYLPELFVGKLPTLNVFNQSKLVEIDRVGNFFHNPIFSFITTEIIWELEDELASNTEGHDNRELIRHPGPVTDESIGTLINDDTVKWVDLDYEEVKHRVLDSLKRLGYIGLSDLLFSSIKSLRTRQMNRDP